MEAKQINHVTDEPRNEPIKEVIQQYRRLYEAGLTPSHIEADAGVLGVLDGCVEMRREREHYYEDDFTRVEKTREYLELGGLEIPVKLGEHTGIKLVAEEQS